MGRGEASLHSDIEFGIIVESKAVSMEWFAKMSQYICSKLEEIGIECDENFSPPHLTPLPFDQLYQKDWRGIYFYPKVSEESKEKIYTKKGSNVMIDTPENLATWQNLKGKIAGSAVVAAILRDGCTKPQSSPIGQPIFHRKMG